MNATARRCALVLLWALSASQLAAADEAPVKTSGRKIVITTSATVQVPPDGARLAFAITTEAPLRVREDNDKQVQKMKERLSALGFGGLEMRIVPLAVNTVTKGAGIVGLAGGAPFGAPPVPPVQSKEVQTLFFVTVGERDGDKLRAMVARLADVAEENGGSAVTADDEFSVPRRFGLSVQDTHRGPSITWLASSTVAARREAIRKALADAQASARAAVGDARLAVTEMHIYGPDDSLLRLRTRPGLERVENGQVAVTVNVQVTYSY
jgi:uncharacterized protein YggE